MTTPVTPATPYVVAAGGLLASFPTGVDFTTIPPGSNVPPIVNTYAVQNVCNAATSSVVGYTNTPLRATLNTEFLEGPNYRVTIQNSTGNVRAIMQRWPVMQVLSVQTSPNTFPRQWTPVTSGYYEPEFPVIGTYGSSAPSSAGEGGQTVLIAPSASWVLGRWGFRLQIQYVSGWPHSSLTATATAGTNTLTVDDITGWAPATTGANGASGTVFDLTGGGQEAITCTAATPASGTLQAGPGTITLKNNLAYAHAAGVMVSALPYSVIWATALYAAADALTRGATATQLRSSTGAAGPPSGAHELKMEAELMLAPYRRTI